MDATPARPELGAHALRYRPPYSWAPVLAHFAARAVAGLEWVVPCSASAPEGAYWRTAAEDGAAGAVAVTHAPECESVCVTVHGFAADAAPRVLPRVLARVRRVFALDVDVRPIGAHLARDPRLAPLVAGRPGLRAPGGWSGFELGVRAVLGQQVSVAAARHLARQLVALCGTPVALPEGVPPRAQPPTRPAYAFPTPAQIVTADLAPLGMPASRKAALRALAEAALADPTLFEAGASLGETVARLRRIRGVGEWTAQYIALRAAGEPDAFPASDAKLLRAGVADGPDALLAHAERWRPWRAYAAQHLWSAEPADVRPAAP